MRGFRIVGLLSLAVLGTAASGQGAAPVVHPPITEAGLMRPRSMEAYVADSVAGRAVRIGEPYVSDYNGVSTRMLVRREGWDGYLSVTTATGVWDQEAPRDYEGWPVWTYEQNGRVSYVIALGPRRRVGFVTEADDEAAAWATVEALDLEGLASAPSDTAYVHPQTREVRWSRAAYRAYADSLAPVRDRLVTLHQLERLLPDVPPEAVPEAGYVARYSSWRTTGGRDVGRGAVVEGSRSVSAPSVPVRHLGATASVSVERYADTPRRVEVLSHVVVVDARDPSLAEPRRCSMWSDAGGLVDVEASGVECWLQGVRTRGARLEEVAEGRWLAAWGTDAELRDRLMASVDRDALASLRAQPVWRWRGPEPTSPMPGEGVLFAGVAPWDNGRVYVGTGEHRPAHVWLDEAYPVGTSRPFSLRPPRGWAVTSRLNKECANSYPRGEYALLTPSPSDPCVLSSGSLFFADAPAVAVVGLRPALQAPVPWLVGWEGFAASLLPGWTAPLDLVREPIEAAGFEGVALALRGDTEAGERHVEAALVVVGDFLIGVLAAAPPSDAEAVREAVRSVARSLRPERD